MRDIDERKTVYIRETGEAKLVSCVISISSKITHQCFYVCASYLDGV